MRDDDLNAVESPPGLVLDPKRTPASFPRQDAAIIDRVGSNIDRTARHHAGGHDQDDPGQKCKTSKLDHVITPADGNTIPQRGPVAPGKVTKVSEHDGNRVVTFQPSAGSPQVERKLPRGKADS